MSFATALSVSDPPGAGGAVPGGRLLGLVQRMMRAGMAMARRVNRIARQRLEGQDLRRMAPAGFDATLTNAFVVQAVAWTAALRERLLALVRPAFVPGLPAAGRGKRGRGAACSATEITYEVSADDHHDWAALARPWRMGPGGVAEAARLIAGKSDRAVVADICDYLRRAAAQLGAEADLERIAALEAAARALCPDVAAAASGGADGAAGARAAGPASDGAKDGAKEGAKEGADDDPPAARPDG